MTDTDSLFNDIKSKTLTELSNNKDIKDQITARVGEIEKKVDEHNKAVAFLEEFRSNSNTYAYYFNDTKSVTILASKNDIATGIGNMNESAYYTAMKGSFGADDKEYLEFVLNRDKSISITKYKKNVSDAAIIYDKASATALLDVSQYRGMGELDGQLSNQIRETHERFDLSISNYFTYGSSVGRDQKINQIQYIVRTALIEVFFHTEIPYKKRGAKDKYKAEWFVSFLKACVDDGILNNKSFIMQIGGNNETYLGLSHNSTGILNAISVLDGNDAKIVQNKYRLDIMELRVSNVFDLYFMVFMTITGVYTHHMDLNNDVMNTFTKNRLLRYDIDQNISQIDVYDLKKSINRMSTYGLNSGYNRNEFLPTTTQQRYVGNAIDRIKELGKEIQTRAGSVSYQNTLRATLVFIFADGAISYVQNMEYLLDIDNGIIFVGYHRVIKDVMSLVITDFANFNAKSMKYYTRQYNELTNTPVYVHQDEPNKSLPALNAKNVDKIDKYFYYNRYTRYTKPLENNEKIMNVKDGKLHVIYGTDGVVQDTKSIDSLFISKKVGSSTGPVGTDDIISEKELESIKAFVGREAPKDPKLQVKLQKNASYELSDEEFFELANKKIKSLKLGANLK